MVRPDLNGVVEYADWRRLWSTEWCWMDWARFFDGPDPDPDGRGASDEHQRLLLLSGHFTRNRFEFDHYTSALPEPLVAFVGSMEGPPILALGLGRHMTVPNAQLLDPVTHGSSGTPDIVWALAHHLGREDLLPINGPLSATERGIRDMALYALPQLVLRTTGPVAQRLMLGEMICDSEPGPGGQREDYQYGLLLLPLLVVQFPLERSGGFWLREVDRRPL